MFRKDIYSDPGPRIRIRDGVHLIRFLFITHRFKLGRIIFTNFINKAAAGKRTPNHYSSNYLMHMPLDFQCSCYYINTAYTGWPKNLRTSRRQIKSNCMKCLPVSIFSVLRTLR